MSFSKLRSVKDLHRVGNRSDLHTVQNQRENPAKTSKLRPQTPEKKNKAFQPKPKNLNQKQKHTERGAETRCKKCGRQLENKEPRQEGRIKENRKKQRESTQPLQGTSNRPPPNRKRMKLSYDSQQGRKDTKANPRRTMKLIRDDWSIGLIRKINREWEWVLVPMGIGPRKNIEGSRAFPTKQEARADAMRLVKACGLKLYHPNSVA